jgi:hypothetical protein
MHGTAGGPPLKQMTECRKHRPVPGAWTCMVCCHVKHVAAGQASQQAVRWASLTAGETHQLAGHTCVAFGVSSCVAFSPQGAVLQRQL